MENGTITIRTKPEIKEKLGLLAETMERSRNWIIEDALKQYLDTQSWQIDGIKEGIKSLDSGERITHEIVKKTILAKIKKHPET